MKTSEKPGLKPSGQARLVPGVVDDVLPPHDATRRKAPSRATRAAASVASPKWRASGGQLPAGEAEFAGEGRAVHRPRRGGGGQ